jgi:hypothetical protein
MKFTQLLKIISDNNGETDTALQKLHNQQEELAKNFHFINVLELANALEFMVRKKVFQKNNIVSCQINFQVEYPYEDETIPQNSISLSFLSLKGKNMSGTVSRYTRGGEKLFEVIRRFENYNSKFINENIDANDPVCPPHKFILQRGCGQEIFNTLLSKEIRLELDYSQMKNDLELDDDEKEEKTANKKLKL